MEDIDQGWKFRYCSDPMVAVRSAESMAASNWDRKNVVLKACWVCVSGMHTKVLTAIVLCREIVWCIQAVMGHLCTRPPSNCGVVM